MASATRTHPSPCSSSTTNLPFLRLYNAFLPYLQAIRGAQFGDGSTYLTYRNSLIIAVLGVPGALLGGLLVELKFFGRKGALAASTGLTGVFLYASTTAVTSDALLGWNCAFNFFSNIMYVFLLGRVVVEMLRSASISLCRQN